MRFWSFSQKQSPKNRAKPEKEIKNRAEGAKKEISEVGVSAIPP
jgi:hypothetical protein